MRILLIVLLMLFVPALCIAATLSWDAPTTYTDGSPIASGDIANMIYWPYTGPSASGPWTSHGFTGEGITSVILPEPEIGQTVWYTVEADLYGMHSAKAGAVSKTVPFPQPTVPVAPSGLSVQ